MNPQHIELAARRLALQQRSAEQRAALARHAAGLAPAAAAVDAVREGLQYLKRHPEWVVGIVGVLIVIRPGRVYRWARRAWTIWRLYRAVRANLSALLARPKPA